MDSSWSFSRSSSEMAANAPLAATPEPPLMEVVGADRFCCSEWRSSIVCAFGARRSWRTAPENREEEGVYTRGDPGEKEGGTKREKGGEAVRRNEEAPRGPREK